MKCDQVTEHLEAYADGEFIDAVLARDIQAHLSDCPSCRQELEALKKLRSVVREKSEYHAAPYRLYQSIASIGVEAPQSLRRDRRQLIWSFANLAWSAAALFLAIFFWPKYSPGPSLEAELVAGHIRSLQASHLFDVPSSDRHTVKPWFQGKLDFSPDVPNLASDGFPLLGGRLDYIGGHPAAALVYARGKHTINVFVLPLSPSSATSDQDGYHIVRWTEHNLTYFAVSDTDALTEFRDRFVNATK